MVCILLHEHGDLKNCQWKITRFRTGFNGRRSSTDLQKSRQSPQLLSDHQPLPYRKGEKMTSQSSQTRQPGSVLDMRRPLQNITQVARGLNGAYQLICETYSNSRRPCAFYSSASLDSAFILIYSLVNTIVKTYNP